MRNKIYKIIILFLVTSSIQAGGSDHEALKQLVKEYDTSYALFHLAFEHQLPFITGKLLFQRLAEIEYLQNTLDKNSSSTHYYQELSKKIINEKKVLCSLVSC